MSAGLINGACSLEPSVDWQSLLAHLQLPSCEIGAFGSKRLVYLFDNMIFFILALNQFMPGI